MKQEIKQLFVEALRSGRFEKGTGRIVNRVYGADGAARTVYCASGVLCALAAEAGVVRNVNDRHYRDDTDTAWIYIAPDSVLRWAGIEGSTYSNPTTAKLITLNDNGASFEEIADVVEREF